MDFNVLSTAPGHTGTMETVTSKCTLQNISCICNEPFLESVHKINPYVNIKQNTKRERETSTQKYTDLKHKKEKKSLVLYNLSLQWQWRRHNRKIGEASRLILQPLLLQSLLQRERERKREDYSFYLVTARTSGGKGWGAGEGWEGGGLLWKTAKLFLSKHGA